MIQVLASSVDPTALNHTPKTGRSTNLASPKSGKSTNSASPKAGGSINPASLLLPTQLLLQK